MKKQIIASSAILWLVASSLPALAISSQAADAPGVVYLGERVDPKTGKKVEGFKFIHYKNGYGKSANAKGKPSGSGSCYAFMVNGAKWKTAENHLVDSQNVEGLDSATDSALLAQATEAWDGQVAADVF